MKLLRDSRDTASNMGAKLRRVAAKLHADAAASGRALDHHRIADAVGSPHRLLGIGQQAAAGRQRHAAVLGDLARGMLQPECPHLVGRRTDEDDAGLGAGLGEAGVFRQEAVAGMDRFGAGGARRFQDAVGVEVAFRNGSRPDADRLAGHGDMQRMPVGFGIDRDGGDPHPIQRSDHAAGDLAAIGDQDFSEHGGFPLYADASQTSTSIGVGL